MDGRGPCGQRSTSGGLVGRARPDRQHRDETPTTAMTTSPCRQPRRSMARMVTGAAAADMPMPSSIQHCGVDREAGRRGQHASRLARSGAPGSGTTYKGSATAAANWERDCR